MWKVPSQFVLGRTFFVLDRDTVSSALYQFTFKKNLKDINLFCHTARSRNIQLHSNGYRDYRAE